MPAAPRSAWRLAVALFVVGLNLRPAIASVAPLLRTVQRDLGMSSAAAGLLTATPVVCMGLLAPGAAVLAHRLGAERVLLGALALLTAATLARWESHTLVPLFASTIVTGVGIALASALLPQIVKAHFPRRGATVTGVYTMGLCAGAAAAAAFTVPLEHALGGSWSHALGAWALLAAIGLAVWAPVARGRVTAPRVVRGRLPWGSVTAWLVMLYIGLQSLMFYATLSWVPPLYQSHGYTAQRAGLLLGAMSVVQIFASVGVPALADRRGGRRSWILLAVSVNIAGLAAVAAAPTVAPLAWMALLGFGAGAAFALGLVLVVDTAVDVHAAGPLSGMAFLGGYLLAAIGPPLVGALHDATGGFAVPFAVLAAVGIAALGCGLGAAPVTRRR